MILLTARLADTPSVSNCWCCLRGSKGGSWDTTQYMCLQNTIVVSLIPDLMTDRSRKAICSSYIPLPSCKLDLLLEVLKEAMKSRCGQMMLQNEKVSSMYPCQSLGWRGNSQEPSAQNRCWLWCRQWEIAQNIYLCTENNKQSSATI